ncbi:hypothetical protein DITRI_Ditri13aG0052400 [Diplodiscus trichospermus]
MELKLWNKSIFGDVNINIEEIRQQLQRVQLTIENEGISKELHALKVKLAFDLDKVLLQPKVHRKEKSRIKWLEEGDKNLEFFHKFVGRMRLLRHLLHLRIQGELVSDPNIITNHVVSFYSDLFNEDSSDVRDLSGVQKVIPKLVTQDDNMMLVEIPFSKEI